MDDRKGVNTSGRPVHAASRPLPQDTMGVAMSLLGETACSEQFLVLWHWLIGLLHYQFPGMVSHMQKKKKYSSSTEWKMLSVLTAGVLLLPEVNLTGLGKGAGGWRMSIFSSHSSCIQFPGWG